jgi:hypothetical protein
MKNQTFDPQKEESRDDSLINQDNNRSDSVRTYSRRRLRNGIGLTITGYLVFLLGARPGLFSLDRSRVIGFVQISVFLVGLGMIVLGSYLTLNNFWPQGKKTIAADIGSRLMSTGYVICLFTSMADIFGMGSHPLPDVFFGPLQANGMAIGMVTIALGILLLLRYKRPELQEPLIEGTKTDDKHSPSLHSN